MEQVNKPQEIRLYRIMRVDATYLKREAVSGRFILRSETKMFKKLYVTHIPIDITEEEWEQLCNGRRNKAYRDAIRTPILHKVKWQAVKYLKATNKIS